MKRRSDGEHRHGEGASLDQSVIHTLFIGALLLLAAVLSSRVAARFGIPALLLFLSVGMLAGSDGPVGIHFDDPRIAMLIGSVALSLILFDGGLQTDVTQISRRILRAGFLLSTVGVVVTAVIVALFAVHLLGFSLLEGFLLGSIVSSTDAAAVFSVLRTRGIALSDRLKRLIEFESGSNDPTAVFLTVTATSLLMGSGSPDVRWLPLQFVIRMLGAGVIGWTGGKILAWLLNRIDLEHDGLYPVLTLATVGCAFGFSESVGTSGFMAVYAMGLTMSAERFIHKKSLIRFHGGAAWLMQVTMFLALGLLVFPSQLFPQIRPALAVSTVLIFIARPVATFVSLLGSGLSVREKIMVSWVGLRGAAPVVLATFPMVAGLGISHTIFNIVFVVVIMSVLFQGPSVGRSARLLGIAEPHGGHRPDPLELEAAGEGDLSLERITVADSSAACGSKLLEIGGRDRAHVVLIRREGWLFIPAGSTRLQAGDELYVIGPLASVEALRRLAGELQAPGDGRG